MKNNKSKLQSTDFTNERAELETKQFQVVKIFRITVSSFRGLNVSYQHTRNDVIEYIHNIPDIEKSTIHIEYGAYPVTY